VRIRCHKCKGKAELGADYARVECASCGLDMAYGDYVREVAHADPAYSDILADYAGTLDARRAGTDDDWD